MQPRLSEAELIVVRKCKVWRFAAFLQRSFLIYPEALNTNVVPNLSTLGKLLEKIKNFRVEFWYYYQDFLPRQSTNPLQVELIQYWNILSRSYKAKLEEMWDKYDECESNLRKLIEELSSTSTGQ